MECPRCRMTLAQGSDSCPRCGFAVEKDTATAVRDIADDVAALRKEQDKLQMDLYRVSRKLETLGAFLEQKGKNEEFRLEPAPTPATPAPESETPASPPIAGPEVQPPHRPEAPKPAPPAQALRQPRKSADHTELELRLGQKWVLVVGIVVMVFGVGYFLKYSFEQGWVGPVGRVTAAYLWGCAFLALGELSRRRPNLERYGLYLLGGGVAVLYFASYAASQIYALLDPLPAFAAMALTTALSMALAMHHDCQPLAVLGLLGGFLTPVLLSTGQDNVIGLMGYLAVLNAGVLAVAFRRNWLPLFKLGFAATYLLYAIWHLFHYHPEKFWPAFLFLHLFFLIYAAVPFACELNQLDSSEPRPRHLAVTNCLVAFAFAYVLIRSRFPTEWSALVALVYATLFLAQATVFLHRERADQPFFTVCAALGGLFITVAVPLALTGQYITLGWALLAAAGCWASRRLSDLRLATGTAVVLGLAFGRLFLFDYPHIFGLTPMGKVTFAFLPDFGHLLLVRLLTEAAVLGSTWFAARQAADWQGAEPHPTLRSARDLLRIGLGLGLAAVLSFEVSALCMEHWRSAAAAALSVLWGVYAIALLVVGLRTGTQAVRMAGLGFFGVTLLKVMGVDMAQVSTPYRIISFVALGLLLVSASYLYHRFRPRITAPSPPESKEHRA